MGFECRYKKVDSKHSEGYAGFAESLLIRICCLFGTAMIQYISGLCEGRIDYLERLPEELIVMILRRCDAVSLAHMSTLNSRFDKVLCDNNSDLFVWTDLSPQFLVKYIAHLQHLAMRFRTEISNHPKWKSNKWSLTGLCLMISNWWLWDTLSNSLLNTGIRYDQCKTVAFHHANKCLKQRDLNR